MIFIKVACNWLQMTLYTRVLHDPNFKASQGMVQGGIISLTLLNVVVDNVVRTWLSMIVEDRASMLGYYWEFSTPMTT